MGTLFVEEAELFRDVEYLLAEAEIPPIRRAPVAGIYDPGIEGSALR